MSRRSKIAVVVTIVLVIAVAVVAWLALSGSSGDPTFDDVRSIVKAMNDHGLDCVNVVLQPVEGLQDFGSCHLADTPENEVDIYVYANRSKERQGYADAVNFHGMAVLEGENWFMTTGTKAEARRIQHAIGGHLR